MVFNVFFLSEECKINLRDNWLDQIYPEIKDAFAHKVKTRKTLFFLVCWLLLFGM